MIWIRILQGFGVLGLLAALLGVVGSALLLGGYEILLATQLVTLPVLLIAIPAGLLLAAILFSYTSTVRHVSALRAAIEAAGEPAAEERRAEERPDSPASFVEPAEGPYETVLESLNRSGKTVARQGRDAPTA